MMDENKREEFLVLFCCFAVVLFVVLLGMACQYIYEPKGTKQSDSSDNWLMNPANPASPISPMNPMNPSSPLRRR